MTRKYKLVQLNVLNFVYFDKIIDFINKENPDIVTFQEVSENNLMRSKSFADTTAYDGKDYISELKNRTNLKYGDFFKSWGTIFTDGRKCNWGIAIFSRFPIVDYSTFFDKNNPKYTLLNKESDPFFISEEKKVRDIYSMQKPAIFAGAMVALDEKLIKVFTGHFAISDLCTETLQRINQVQQFIEFINNQKQYPTVISADFNMTEEGMSVQQLKNHFTYAAGNITNTLDTTVHPIFDPSRAVRNMTVHELKVDHIFYRGVNALKCTSPNGLGLSDHNPIIFEFEI